MIRPGPVEPRPYEATSATLNEVLRSCLLKASFRSDSQFKELDQPGPAARMGTACHRLIEASFEGEFNSVSEADLPATLERRWDEEVRTQANISWPPGVTPVEPSSWPYYQLKKVQLRRWLLDRIKNRRGESSRRAGGATVERSVVGFDGRLRGTPDLVLTHDDGVEIVDFKSGEIIDHDEPTGNDEMRAAYRRQLLIYSALHHDETGEWPAKATLQNMKGDRLSFDVIPDEATQEAASAVSLLQQYNQSVADGAVSASPGAEVCRFCPFAGVCRPFFDAIHVDWDWYLVYVMGTLVKVEKEADGRFGLTVRVTVGNVPEAASTLVLHGLSESEMPPDDTSGIEVSIAAAERMRSETDIRVGGSTQVWYWPPEDRT